MNTKFEYQFDKNSPKTVVTVSPEADLDEVLRAFEDFLLGAGYRFVGKIQLVETDNDK